MRDLVLGTEREDAAFWKDAELLLDICKPILEVLRLCDADKPCSADIYYAMFNLCEVLKTAPLGSKRLTLQRRAAAHAIAEKRWEFMHAPIYAAAYALNPKYWSHDVFENDEVMEGLAIMAHKLLSGDEPKTALEQFDDWKRMRGPLGNEIAVVDAKSMLHYKWWRIYGGPVQSLQRLALLVVSQVTTASACERNRSAYDTVIDKKRNRTSPDTAKKLVYVFQNLRAVYKGCRSPERLCGSIRCCRGGH